MPKPELEFTPAEEFPWQALGLGLHERILARDPDTGVVSRLLRFDPGADTTPNGVLTHDYWEELLILEGSLYDLSLGRWFHKGAYACRPPGMRHGPWRTDEGCLTFEVRYKGG